MNKKINKKTKSLLALLTALLLILSCLGTAASAAETGTAGEDTIIGFTDSGVSVTGIETGVSVSGTDVKINAAGTYTLTGSCADGSVTVKKNVTGVTLILDNLDLTASATAPVTCNKGSGVTIIAKEGSVNTLTDDKYNNDDIYTDTELYPDIENAVIKCKDGSDVTICGTGTININSYGKNGIKGGYDLYEEDADGNATDTLLSPSSLTVKDVTLNITASVNDGLKADKELNILSGSITVSAADDGIKSDYTLNIGAAGTDGPVINVAKSTEGIEAATLNVYSGRVTVYASDDGINAANSDLSGYSFSYNQYGGYVYVNCENGDGIDSNGTVTLNGGTLEVYSPSQGDGDPIDSDGGTVFGGATVLAAGHNAMQQSYSAKTPYVVFGGSEGAQGGFPGNPGRPGRNGIQSGSAEEAFGPGAGASLVSAGSAIAIKDSSGNTLYSAQAVRDASYIVFASPSLTSGETYTLYSGETSAATAVATTASSGGMQPGGQPGDQPGEQPATQTGPDETGDGETGSIFSGILAFFARVWSWIMSVIGNISALF